MWRPCHRTRHPRWSFCAEAGIHVILDVQLYKALVYCRARKRAPFGSRLALRGGRAAGGQAGGGRGGQYQAAGDDKRGARSAPTAGGLMTERHHN